MASIALLIFVAFAAFAWVRSTQRRRQRWLRRLSLPGVWVSQGEAQRTIEFKGGRDAGTFVTTGLAASQGSSDDAPADAEVRKHRGDWAVRGSYLELAYEGGSKERLALTFYDIGKIGLERGPGQRTYFQKQTANVVPLHSRRA